MGGRRRFVTWARLLLALSLVVPTTALARVVPLPAAVGVAAFVWWAMVRAAYRVLRDEERSRWTVRFLDEPLFWIWGGGTIALLLLPMAAVAVIVAALSGVRVELALDWALFGVVFAGAGLSAWGVWPRRRWVVVREITVPIAGLPAEFDGYRIAHLSDLHIGSFDPLARGLQWAQLTNRCRPDLTVLTGDFVTSGVRHYAAAAEVVGALRAPDGVLVSMGNHDQWDNARLTREFSERGVKVLKNSTVHLRRDQATVIVAGLDDAYTGKADLERTLALASRSHVVVLLAHYPDHFEAAAARGVALVLSGHTHGGQIAFPFLDRSLGLAPLTRQRPRGLFNERGSWLYVNAGLGTTGPPLRLGVPPEIAILTLRVRAQSKLSE